MKHDHFDVAIIGGGVIGLSIGWRLSQRGFRTVILERADAGRATSWASGGMLGPQVEIGFEDLELYALGIESMRLWPSFASELEETTGMSVDYRTEGTLLVSDDRDGAAHIRRVFAFQQQHGIPVSWITPSEAGAIEPFLSPRITAAVFSEADHQVDPRRLVNTLKRAFIKAGGTLKERTSVQRVELGRAHPVCKTDDGAIFEAASVVVAAGPWSGELAGLPGGTLPVRPVKGQMLELRMSSECHLRCVVRGQGIYLAPKRNGRLLVGATSEEMGFDTRVTAGGMYELLERAWRLVPGIYELEITDTWAGLRPASVDHDPIIGFSSDNRVLFATGHYRNGIMLTPVTAEGIAMCIETGEPPAFLNVCTPSRLNNRKANA